MKLILFDIDGTLLWSDGAGRRAMETALHEHFDYAGSASYRYDGKTDRQIAREQMRDAGFDDATIDARMASLLARYLEHLDAALTLDSNSASLCHGITPLLDMVEQQDAVVMGLLTGNVEGGASRKLKAVGVEFSRFRVNAFGSDHEHRPELPAIAQRRAFEMLGRRPEGEQIVIIGDTPADIACGRAVGARAIGVATGRYTVDELAEHNPYAVFPDLTDTSAVLEALLA